MNATMVPRTPLPVKRPEMLCGTRKRLYDAAIQLTTYRATEVDEYSNTACYAGNGLVVTHYRQLGEVTVEAGDHLVYRVQGCQASDYRPGPWEAMLLHLAENALRRYVR